MVFSGYTFQERPVVTLTFKIIIIIIEKKLRWWSLRVKKTVPHQEKKFFLSLLSVLIEWNAMNSLSLFNKYLISITMY